jgi:5-formyltetrahydrofolate cyclo-ligase
LPAGTARPSPAIWPSRPSSNAATISPLISATTERVGTEPLFDEIWTRGKEGYLPILRSTPVRCLWFGRYRPETVLTRNRFRIPEPAIGENTLDEPWRLDLALVPLVAFDLAGNRIGMGGGYYDRTFAYLKEAGAPRSPALIGLAFECQKHERLPAESWDVPLDGVVTEKAFYTFTDLPGTA